MTNEPQIQQIYRGLGLFVTFSTPLMKQSLREKKFQTRQNKENFNVILKIYSKKDGEFILN